jgi:hypothetical protein
MRKLKSFYLTLVVLFSARLLNAQQPVQSTINMDAVKVVSFKQLADYEAAHPSVKIRRFVEQGEDLKEEFHFIPKDITPDAIHFDIPAPQHQTRALINSPAPSVSFNGTLDNGTLIPPDIRGAAGINHIMETTNQEFKIYSKTGTLVSTLSISTFFASTGGSGYFDPHLLFDATNSRWIVCIAGKRSNGDGGIFIGVSQTSDPTGSWYVYSFDGIGNANDFLDYPLMGYNTNWVVVTGNDFLSAGGVTGKIYVMNRASLYSGTLGTVNTFSDGNVFSLAPAQTLDATQTTLYMVEDWNGNSGGNGYVRIGKITGTPTAPVYTAGTTLGVNQPWSENSVGIPQSGSTQKIEGGDTRIGNSVYVNGSLWFCQTAFLPASSPTRSAVQWWQVNPATPSVQQFGRVDGGSSTGTFYFYPDIAVNTNGDMMLGHCQSSSTSFASASYSVRASTDAINTTQNPYTYKAGLASYYKTFSGTRNRWGDYTGAAVDPSNNSFWNFNEWANTSNKWGTAIANVSVTAPVPCAAVTALNTTGIGNTAATLNWTAAANALSYNIQYRIVGAASWSTATTANAFFSLTGLNAATNYEWQVQTVCSSGSSAFTSSSTFTTTGTAPCNTPASLNTVSITVSSATFNWAAATGALSYNIQYRIVGAATWTSATAAINSYSAAGLTAGSNYEWQVRTVCASGTSAYSASALFTTTSLSCGVPTGLASSGIGNNAATLSWTAVSGASSYNLQWKLSTASTWTPVSALATNSYSLSGLTACSAYQFQVQANCAGTLSAFSSTASLTTTGCAITYCTSKGTSTSYEYIKQVAIGTISNLTGSNAGYGNFTNLSTNLAGGTSATIALTPGFMGSAYSEFWTVYIDYNHNGSFADAGEKVTTGASTAAISRTFTVPTTALNGATRMRVQMQYGAYTTNSCTTYTYGEVEDYTVNITGNAQAPAYYTEDAVDPEIIETTEPFTLFPNPANDNITVRYMSRAEGNVSLQVYSITGQKVLTMASSAAEGVNTQDVNTTILSNGVYIFEVQNHGDIQRQKFTISK